MSSNASFQIEGWDDLIAKYGRENSEKAVESSLENSASVATDEVKRKLRGQHHRTGFLVNSIQFEVKGKEARIFASSAGTPVYYARYVEEGTGIHGPRSTPIRPKSAQRLAWHPTTATGAPGAGLVVRSSVAGQKPVRMFARTYEEDRKKIVDAFISAFARIFGS